MPELIDEDEGFEVPDYQKQLEDSLGEGDEELSGENREAFDHQKQLEVTSEDENFPNPSSSPIIEEWSYSIPIDDLLAGSGED